MYLDTLIVKAMIYQLYLLDEVCIEMTPPNLNAHQNCLCALVAGTSKATRFQFIHGLIHQHCQNLTRRDLNASVAWSQTKGSGCSLPPFGSHVALRIKWSSCFLWTLVDRGTIHWFSRKNITFSKILGIITNCHTWGEKVFPLGSCAS